MIEIEKILLEFREEMLSEDVTENTIRNYLADVRIFYKWYAEIEYSGDLKKMTFHHMNGLNPEAYLKKVMSEILDYNSQKLHELLPWNIIPDTS